mmetsp:Transcript_36447/g.55953  ORF Transcript_36447/g.55953 Transcript_36447/m.55953 type:complete len:135 (-) Transcript_36447:2874-3278(-)
MVYIQIGLQIALKGTMVSLDDLLIGFYCIQLCCYFSIYNTPVPSFADIYIKEFRKLINFDLLKPDKILAAIPGEWQLNNILNIQQEKLTASSENSGFESSSFLINTQTWIFMTVLFGIALLILLVTTFFKTRFQ